MHKETRSTLTSCPAKMGNAGRAPGIHALRLSAHCHAFLGLLPRSVSLVGKFERSFVPSWPSLSGVSMVLGSPSRLVCRGPRPRHLGGIPPTSPPLRSSVGPSVGLLGARGGAPAARAIQACSALKIGARVHSVPPALRSQAKNSASCLKDEDRASESEDGFRHEKRDRRKGYDAHRASSPLLQSPSHPDLPAGPCPESLPQELHSVALQFAARRVATKEVGCVLHPPEDARGTPPFISPEDGAPVLRTDAPKMRRSGVALRPDFRSTSSETSTNTFSTPSEPSVNLRRSSPKRY